MRVTTDMQFQGLLRNVQRTLGDMAKLQDQVSSGVRLKRPSDGPADMVRVLQNRNDDARFAAQLTNIRDATIALDTSTTALNDAKSVLIHAKDVALQAANTAVNDSGTNEPLAQEIDGAIQSLLQVANRKRPDGTYLFAGTASLTPPFAIAASDKSGRPTQVAYQGTAESSQVLVGDGQTLQTSMSGDVFQLHQRAATVFTGSSGAKAGTGTDSAHGQGELLVQHTLTSFEAGSGVAPGTSSVSGDTIIGPAGSHSLTITDDGTGAGMVSLNGGPPVAYQSSDADLKVTGPQGEVVFLDTTAIIPGFAGSVAIAAAGTLSLDGGLR